MPLLYSILFFDILDIKMDSIIIFSYYKFTYITKISNNKMEYRSSHIYTSDEYKSDIKRHSYGAFITHAGRLSPALV